MVWFMMTMTMLLTLMFMAVFMFMLVLMVVIPGLIMTWGCGTNAWWRRWVGMTLDTMLTSTWLRRGKLRVEFSLDEVLHVFRGRRVFFRSGFLSRN